MWQPPGASGGLGPWSQLIGGQTSATSATYTIAGSGQPNRLVLFNGYWLSSNSFVHTEFTPTLLKGRFRNVGGVADTDRQFGLISTVPAGMDPEEPVQHYARFRLFVNTSGDTEWVAQCNNGVAGSETASTGLAAADTDWHDWEIRLAPVAGTTRFYLDGVQVALFNSRFPEASMSPVMSCKVFAGAGQNMELASIWTICRSWERQ